MPETKTQKRSRPDDGSINGDHDQPTKRLKPAEEPEVTIFSPAEELTEATFARDLDNDSPPPAERPKDPDNSQHDYKPLDASKNEIRLLRLSPIQDNTDKSKREMIHCSLFRVSMDNPPDFEALSYHWGDRSEQPQIMLDDELFSVTSNLGHALHHLRLPSVARTLWIDAICINQTDISERNEQVQNMQKIYQLASRVIAWVGITTVKSTLAFSLLSQLTARDRGEIGRDIRVIIRDPENYPLWEALSRFFLRPYWKRIWVVQELAMAKKAIITCGEDSIGWTELLSVQKLLQIFTKDLEELVLKEPSFRSASRWTALGPSSMRNGLEDFSSSPPPLLDIIRKHYNKDATEPKDKIYALVGLTSIRNQPKIFPIDYKKSTREVYTQVVKYALSETGKLDIMCTHPRDSNPRTQKYKTDDLPSWLPDWGPRFSGAIPLAGRCNPTQAEVVLFRNDDRILDVKGYCFDKIAAISEKSRTENPFAEEIANSILDFHSWRSFFKSKTSNPSYSIEDDKILCRTLLADYFRDTRDHWKPASDAYYDILCEITQRSRKLHPSIELEEPLLSCRPRLVPRMYSSTKSEIMYTKHIHKMTINVRMRRFIISSNGRVGIALDTVNEGDLLCMIGGFSRPIILRPREDGGFIFQGEAYIDDYNKGSPEEELEEGKHELQNFEIH